MVDFFSPGGDAFASQVIRAAIESSGQIQLSNFTFQQAATEKNVAQRLRSEAVDLRIRAEEKDREADIWLQSAEERERAATAYVLLGREKVRAVGNKVVELKMNRGQMRELLIYAVSRIELFEAHYPSFGQEMSEELAVTLAELKGVYVNWVIENKEVGAEGEKSEMALVSVAIEDGGETTTVTPVSEQTSETKCTSTITSSNPPKQDEIISKAAAEAAPNETNPSHPRTRLPLRMPLWLPKTGKTSVDEDQNAQSIDQLGSKSSPTIHATTRTSPPKEAEEGISIPGVFQESPSRAHASRAIVQNSNPPPRTVQPVPEADPRVLWDFAFPYTNPKLGTKGKNQQQFSELRRLKEQGVHRRTLLLVSDAGWATMTKTWLTEFGSAVGREDVAVIHEHQTGLERGSNDLLFVSGRRKTLVCQTNLLYAGWLARVEQVFWLNLKGKDQSHAAQKDVVRDVVNMIVDSKGGLEKSMAIKVVFAGDERSIARQVMKLLFFGDAECKTPLSVIDGHFPVQGQ